MKLLFCIVVAWVAAASCENMRAQLHKKTEECRKNATNIQELSREEMKCLGACYLEKVGLMDKANKLVPTKLDALMDPTVKSKNGKTFKSVSKDIAGKCKKATDKDKCEAAVKIVTCLYEETMKLGFDSNLLY